MDASSKKFLDGLKKAHVGYDAARQETIAYANAALHASKRATFAVQRGDAKGAGAMLKAADLELAKIRAMAKENPRLSYEGSYRAALEEYAEARFVAMLAAGEGVSAIDGLDEETQIGGLCDAAGELVRMMIAAATEGRDKDAATLKARVDEIVGALTEMDFGGYLRTKYDQARSHLRKAEEIMYDLSLRKR